MPALPVALHVLKLKLRIFGIYWLPVLVWMLVIFGASGDSHSFKHSSRLIGPVVRWLFPQISDHALYRVVFGVRKCAHVTEYAVLALLIWRGLRKPVRNDDRPWQWRHARLTLVLVMLYAGSDELHQAFVPTREASVLDVFIDTGGAALGLGALWMAGRWRRRW